MLHYTRRGDRFGPQRKQLALWGLARVALSHNIPEAYSALQGGLDDRNADVRYATADMILNAYLRAGRDVPQDVVDRLRHMALSDSDDSVRHAAQRQRRRLRRGPGGLRPHATGVHRPRPIALDRGHSPATTPAAGTARSPAAQEIIDLLSA